MTSEPTNIKSEQDSCPVFFMRIPQWELALRLWYMHKKSKSREAVLTFDFGISPIKDREFYTRNPAPAYHRGKLACIKVDGMKKAKPVPRTACLILV